MRWMVVVCVTEWQAAGGSGPGGAGQALHPQHHLALHRQSAQHGQQTGPQQHCQQQHCYHQTIVQGSCSHRALHNRSARVILARPHHRMCLHCYSVYKQDTQRTLKSPDRLLSGQLSAVTDTLQGHPTHFSSALQ